MSILVVPYDAQWPERFIQLATPIHHHLRHYAVTIEHVGSTAVPHLTAKPVIDMDIIATNTDEIPAIINDLVHLGYHHRGNLGIEGREAFTRPQHLPAHNLYLGHHTAPSIRNHLLVRDYLRQHPHAVKEYAQLKMQLAHTCGDDINAYVAGKSEFLAAILLHQGMDTHVVTAIMQQNLPPTYTTPLRP